MREPNVIIKILFEPRGYGLAGQEVYYCTNPSIRYTEDTIQFFSKEYSRLFHRKEIKAFEALLLKPEILSTTP